MNIADMFEKFLNNLKITEARDHIISLRYGEITKALNLKFNGTNSLTSNRLRVGSYGRFTAINNLSDLDMLYILPDTEWENYRNNGQVKLLDDVKKAIEQRYPTTELKKDRLVVQVKYNDFLVEVQPVFRLDSGGFCYPDTYDGGKWKETKPHLEIKAMRMANEQKNNNLRNLCRMLRAWKNKHGVVMGGLLIDTLAYNFLMSTSDYDDKSYSNYPDMIRDFFEYLSKLDSQRKEYLALGSNQKVKVKEPFVRKAERALDIINKAFNAETLEIYNLRWRDLFGRYFPKLEIVSESQCSTGIEYKNTEEFIDLPINIQYALEIDCSVSQPGFRTYSLRYLLTNKLPLLKNKTLTFHITKTTVPEPYTIKWKILNRGEQAKRRNCIRGQILTGNKSKIEHTNFDGEHIVECYIIKDDKVVAKDYIDVPIV